MTIRRDDLVAAAAAGLLQYRQVDPLLVFLLQRDIRAKRQALANETHAGRYRRVNELLSYAVALLAVLTASLFGLLFAGRATQVLGQAAIFLFAAVYVVAGMGLAAWFRRRGYAGRVHLALAVLMAAVPLAVVALQKAPL